MTKKKDTKYLIKVTADPDFCGVDAGGVHFAHGEAVISDVRMAAWFSEHAGYDVTEIRESADEK